MAKTVMGAVVVVLNLAIATRVWLGRLRQRPLFRWVGLIAGRVIVAAPLGMTACAD